MTEFLIILLSTVLVNNFVLVKFLGLCPFMGVSQRLDTAIGMGLATVFVMTLASICGYFINNYLLEPYGLEYLRTLTYIYTIAVLVSFTEMVMRKTSPLLHKILGIYLPLITTNCAVLGVALLNSQNQYNLLQSAIFGAGSAVGFSFVMVIFASLRERLDVSAVPLPFKGIPIALITAGFMSMAFMGFSGMVT